MAETIAERQNDLERAGDRLNGRDDEDLANSVYEPVTANSGATERYYQPTLGRAHLSGLFNSKNAAENAVYDLEGIGALRTDISVLAAQDGFNEEFNRTTNKVVVDTYADQGAGTGAVAGGTLGIIVGAIVGAASSIVLPGIGIIAGPIAGALVGAGAAGLTGGVLGALIGAGIPRETAEVYADGIRSGGVVVIVDVPLELEARAREVLRNPHI